MQVFARIGNEKKWAPKQEGKILSFDGSFSPGYATTICSVCVFRTGLQLIQFIVDHLTCNWIAQEVGDMDCGLVLSGSQLPRIG